MFYVTLFTRLSLPANKKKTKPPLNNLFSCCAVGAKHISFTRKIEFLFKKE
jgi:hypothetical protein